MDKTYPPKPSPTIPPVTRTEHIRAVMATYREGENWQHKPLGFTMDWIDIGFNEPAWDWANYNYRKKPEPERPTKPESTHRPYDPEEVPFGTLVRVKGETDNMGLVAALILVSTLRTPHIIVSGLGTFNLTETLEKLEYTHEIQGGRDYSKRTWYPFGQNLEHDTKPTKPTS